MKKIVAFLLALTLILSATMAFAITVSEMDSLVWTDPTTGKLTLNLPAGWDYKVSEDGVVKVQSEETDANGVRTIVLTSAISGDKQAQVLMGEDLTADNCAVCTFSIEGGAITGSEAYIQQNELQDGEFTVDADGKTITVRLEGNPTTGFEWTFIPDNSGVLELVSEEYISAATDATLCGAGGTYVYVLKVVDNPVGSDTTPLFTYARSWEDEAPIKEYTLSIGLNENNQINFAESTIYVR